MYRYILSGAWQDLSTKKCAQYVGRRRRKCNGEIGNLDKRHVSVRTCFLSLCGQLCFPCSFLHSKIPSSLSLSLSLSFTLVSIMQLITSELDHAVDVFSFSLSTSNYLKAKRLQETRHFLEPRRAHAAILQHGLKIFF